MMMSNKLILNELKGTDSETGFWELMMGQWTWQELCDSVTAKGADYDDRK
jgi:hypothetical protein